ncbi:hypothetical protein KB879_35800 (plasmid) [Cupriavidus sp. KK10]|uniref:hypothetical protein n=1 Tax=Cupriavidus sp. KK10 TaxID=1478019 RepID=UPI001BA580C8|nr:hypothetical protein [Cupriavidus sp. KK10]QUN31726.1 hypothetical protein KB879_35800 [Cupriavidus sp. KK10]
MRPEPPILFLPPLVLALALAGCANMRTGSADTPTSAEQSLAVMPAPVPPDGYTAGAATHLVFVLVPNSDPAVEGIELKRGDTLGVSLPAAFKRNDKVRLQEDSDFNLTLNKGWPQAAVKQAGQYKIFFDERTNTIGVRAEQDVAAEGANSPGVKRIHLRGETFMNPVAGAYPVEVRLVAGDGTVRKTWKGTIQILSAPTAARLAPTNFHLGPGMNGDFQKAGVNRDAPLLLGVLLWDQSGQPLNGVGIAPPDRTRFPRYTGGLLVQHTRGDKTPDPANDRVVGGIIGAAPTGATGQSATTPIGGDGKPILSGEMTRHAAFPATQGGGKPNPGLMPIRFHTGSKAGLYRPTVELLGGNGYQFTIDAQ